VDSVDDLGVVDALEVDRHDAEVGVLDMRVIAKSNRGPITRMDPALCGVIFDPGTCRVAVDGRRSPT
jgi:hypothetical protein